MRTVKNEYGEEIHIKYENDELYIHHTDCTEDFVTLGHFLFNCFINNEELVLLFKTMAEMQAERLKNK